MATATDDLAYSVIGTGLVKTTDIGGSRFGAWSSKAFSPISFVQETLTVPPSQLSIPPNYGNLASYGLASSKTSSQLSSATAAPYTPQSPVFWMVGALLFLGVFYYLKRTHKIK